MRWGAGSRWCSCRATWSWRGPGAVRRQYLDRLLSLADREYLRSLSRYRAALAQRNSALRQRRPELAWAFDEPLAAAGARIVAARDRWSRHAARAVRRRVRRLGERGRASLRYRGSPELADPAAWDVALDGARTADRTRGMSTVGPHRDDLRLEIGERALREYGSHRPAANRRGGAQAAGAGDARGARETEPALLLDDVFAELDEIGSERLAARLVGRRGPAGVLTAPRAGRAAPGTGAGGVAVRDGRVSGAGGMSEIRKPSPIAEALASYLRRSGFAKRIQQAGVIEAWPELVGPQIAAVTAAESVTADGVLRVRVTTAPGPTSSS